MQMKIFFLFAGFNRKFSELFEILHECKSSFAGACAGSLVALFYLSLSVYCELLILFLDFLNDLFHDVISLLVKH